MKFKELITYSENKITKQINMSLRKKQLKKGDMSFNDLLNQRVMKENKKSTKKLMEDLNE